MATGDGRVGTRECETGDAELMLGAIDWVVPGPRPRPRMW